MNLTDVITGTPVTPEELRAARDRRILKKWELLSAGDGSCLVEFSLNIAGAVKVFPFARAAFREELRELQEKLGRFSIKNTKICEEPTGDHAFFLLDSPEIPVKQFLVSIEEMSSARPSLQSRCMRTRRSFRKAAGSSSPSPHLSGVRRGCEYLPGPKAPFHGTHPVADGKTL